MLLVAGCLLLLCKGLETEADHMCRSHEQMSADIVDLVVGQLEESRGRDYVEAVLPQGQVPLPSPNAPSTIRIE